jgi:DNA (cytosine-5)-methyltransferase 1
MTKKLNYIDLFAGAGGLSEGFIKAGFNPIAHVEVDINACKTLKTRSAFHYLKKKNSLDIYYSYIKQEITAEQFYQHIPAEELNSVLNYEISDLTIDNIFKDIDKLRDGKKIDLIVGGPPCQVYSLIGRSKIGLKNVADDRRYRLYIYYGSFLKKYKPDYFVFENVQGLLSAGNSQLIHDIELFLEDCGYKVKYKLLDASDFGVLQKRKRVILIGKKGKRNFNYPDFEECDTGWNVNDALFGDLKKIEAGNTIHVKPYSVKKANDYLKNFHLRNGADFVTQHITRPHLDRDLEIYGIAASKWINYNERLRYSDLPARLKNHKNETSFLDRYKVVNGDGISHTLVAHIGRDGHYFIYPELNNPRSISIREAARIQAFSDDYFFEGGRTSAFKQIGNAVPPIMSFKIANTIKELL